MTEQFNVRLRDGLGQAVRLYAVSRGDGTRPRDVIEQALEAAGFGRDGSIESVRLPGPESREAVKGQDRADGDGAPAVDGRRGTARRSRRAVARQASHDAPDPQDGQGGEAAVSDGTPRRGCPECGGDLAADESSDLLVCVECQTAVQP